MVFMLLNCFLIILTLFFVEFDAYNKAIRRIGKLFCAFIMVLGCGGGVCARFVIHVNHLLLVPISL